MRLRPAWFKNRWLRLLAAGPILLVLAGCAYAGVAQWMLRREIERTPRDAQTGVMVGAEARDLDPPGFDPARPEDRPTTACLLIHGFVGTPRDFGDLPERLAARGFHVRAMSVAGHGTTPRDFADENPATLYEGVLAEFRAVEAEYEAVNVVGFSMGGTLATQLAAREKVHRLVLAAPYYRVTYMWYYVLPAETWNALLSPFIPYVVKMGPFTKVNRPEARSEVLSYHAVPTHGVRTLLLLARSARRPQTLGAIDCPTLMTISDGDEAASPRAARRAFDKLGSADKTFLAVPKTSNHILFLDYDREQVKTAVEDFLTRPID